MFTDKEGTIRAVKSDKSKPASHIGTRASWETQQTGFGRTGFGRLGFGSVQGWAKGISKPFGKIRPNPNGPGCVCARMPEVGFERNKTTPIRNLRGIKPMPELKVEAIPKIVGMPQLPDFDNNAHEMRKLEAINNVRQKICALTSSKIRKKGKPDESPFTEIKYIEKKVGKKGKRTRFFTKAQGYNNLPPLPKSGGLTEEELVRMRERSVPRD